MIVIKEEFMASVKTKRAYKLGGGDAILLWLALRGYVATSNTGGFVPDDAIEDLPLIPKQWKKAMRALIECGKKREDGERGPGLVVQSAHGYQLHDYDDHGTPVEVEEARRRKAREARAKHRASLRVGPSVYFARVLNSGLVKIGYSENPHDRCRTLPADLGSKVELIGYEPGTKEDEARLHAEFAEERRGNTELFEPTDRVLARAMRSSFRYGPDPDPIRKPDPKTRSGPDPNDRNSTRSDAGSPRASGHGPAHARTHARARAGSPAQPSPTQPNGSDQKTTTQDLTASPPDEPPEQQRQQKIRCPIDLEVDQQTLAGWQMNPGIPPDLARFAVRRWAAKQAADPDDRRFLGAWRKSAAAAVLGDWSHSDRVAQLRREFEASKRRPEDPEVRRRALEAGDAAERERIRRELRERAAGQPPADPAETAAKLRALTGGAGG